MYLIKLQAMAKKCFLSIHIPIPIHNYFSLKLLVSDGKLKLRSVDQDSSVVSTAELQAQSCNNLMPSFLRINSNEFSGAY